MNILFCHGKEGSPDGTKAQTIRAAFGNVVTPTLTNSYAPADFKTTWKLLNRLLKKMTSWLVVQEVALWFALHEQASKKS